MIGSLRGTLACKETSRVIVETGGVGYLVHVPLSTLFVMGDPGTETSLRVHTHVRDDAIQLFGFATEAELRLFEKLIAITGIGPKMALNILSGIPVDEFLAAIRDQDLRRLTAVPGLGKKTGERLVLELREKLDDIILLTRVRLPRVASLLREDARSALVNLGYRERDADAALVQVEAQATKPPDLESLLRAALAALAK